jgi:hypothetical protein
MFVSVAISIDMAEIFLARSIDSAAKLATAPVSFSLYQITASTPARKKIFVIINKNLTKGAIHEIFILYDISNNMNCLLIYQHCNRA